MSTTETQTTAPAPAESQPEKTWRRLAALGAYAIPIIFALLMVYYRTFIPFFLIFIVVFAGLGFWVSRGGRASAIVLAVLAVLFIVMNVPFIIPTLNVPESFVDFTTTAWILLAALTALVAGIMAFRTSEPSAGARTFERAVAGLAVIAVVYSLVATATYDGAVKQDGDIEVTTADLEFEPAEVESGGTVAIFVTNDDPTTHTFTIDDLDVNLDIPANQTARIEFEAEPGEYRFYCVPHQPDMEGTLTIE